jgi:hypothetical protein
MINIVVDPLLIPILVMIIAELFRVEGRLSRLEEKFELLIKRREKKNEY